jgi:hypothetical protein
VAKAIKAKRDKPRPSIPPLPKPPPPWLETARRLYEEDGLSLRAVAEAVGVGDGKVLKVFKQHGIPTRPNSSRKKLTDDQLHDALKLAAAGRTARDIAERFAGVSAGDVRQALDWAAKEAPAVRTIEPAGEPAPPACGSGAGQATAWPVPDAEAPGPEVV